MSEMTPERIAEMLEAGVSPCQSAKEAARWLRRLKPFVSGAIYASKQEAETLCRGPLYVLTEAEEGEGDD